MGARAQPLGEITGQLQALRECSFSYNQPSNVGRHFLSPQCSVPFVTRGSFSLQPPHFDVKKAGESLASPTCGCAIAWRDNHPGQSGFPGQIQMEAAQSLNEKLEIFFWGCLSRKRSKESYSLKNVMFLSQLYIFQLRSQQF